MLNLNCAVCLDLFKPNDNVEMTKCGHVFHEVCVNLWLKRSATCPQCRKKSRKGDVSRIFFNTSKSGQSRVDVKALTAQLENVRLRIKQKDQEFEKLEEELKSLKEMLEKQENAEKERKQSEKRTSSFIKFAYVVKFGIAVLLLLVTYFLSLLVF